VVFNILHIPGLFLSLEIRSHDQVFFGFPESLCLVQMVCFVSTVILLKCSGIAKQYFV